MKATYDYVSAVTGMSLGRNRQEGPTPFFLLFNELIINFIELDYKFDGNILFCILNRKFKKIKR